MADPLSIAASVAGLLGVAGNVCTIISGFISSVTDAPSSAQDALAAVDETRMVLISVKLVMNKLSRLPRNRKEMIHVRHLVITFRELIQSFSELEAIVNPAVGADRWSTKWDRVKWVLEEEKILRSVQRLELHKNSLSMMLNILHWWVPSRQAPYRQVNPANTASSESDLEARRSLNTLQDTVQQVLDQNQTLLRLLEERGFHRGAEDASIRFFEDDHSVIQTQGSSSDGTGSRTSPPMLPKLGDSIPLEAAFNSAISPPEYQTDLDRSRVYSRTQSNDSDVSFTSSAVRTNAWSMLTGLSLSDISVISVITLPISLEEINSIGPNLTFAKMMSGTEKLEPTRTELSRALSKSRERVFVRIRPSLRNIPGLARQRSSGRLVAERPPVLNPDTSDNIQSGRLGAGKMTLYKVVVLGDGDVGKTGFITQVR